MAETALSVLMVNRNARNLQLLCEYLAKEGFQTLAVSTYEEFDQILFAQSSLSAALIDITGFDSLIWSRCEQLRTRKIPFLIVSAQLSAALQQASLTHGARGVMAKPLVVKEFIGIIRSMINE
jgi:DNA-binding response OmpR family regulator